MSRKENRAFNFSVEGQTEKWYLLWLARQINAANPKYNAVISPVVERSPLRYSKSQTNYSGSMFFHVCDLRGRQIWIYKILNILLMKLKAVN